MKGFYKDQRKVEIRVGIIVIATILILVLGYAWLRNALQLEKQTQIKVRFPNAQGLEIGDKITVNGMQAGRVKAITQLKNGVLVEGSITLKHPLTDRTEFIIQDSNLMGGKQLEIISLEGSKLLDTNQILEGNNGANLNNLIKAASTALDNINQLIEKFNQPNGVVDKTQKTLEDADKTVKIISNVIDENKSNLTQAISQLNTSTKELNDILTKNKNHLDRTLQNAPEILEKTKSTLDSLQTATTVLKQTIKQITKGTGTLPLLINDEELYKKLNNTTARLDSLLIDIKKNPKRYFQIKVF